MKKRIEKKPEQCPKCGSTQIAEILYGLCDISEIEEDIESGKVVLGGCCITGDDPKWECQTCKNQL